MGLFMVPPLALSAVVGQYTVVTPLHNKRNTVRASLLSALNQERRPFEVIVVDDKSTDGSLDQVSDLMHKLTVIRNDENIGKAASIEKALKIVQTPYTLILDADTILEKDFANEVLKGFHSREVAGTTGAVLPLDVKTKTQQARLIEYLLGVPGKIFQSRIHGVWTLAGAAMMWKTKVLRKIGLSSDTVVEDMDASWRAQALINDEGKHYSLGYAPDAIAFTEEPKSFKEFISQVDRWFSIGPVITKNFREIRRSLKLLTAWFLVEAVMPGVWLGVMGWLIYTSNFLTAGLLTLIDLAILAIISMYLGIRRNYGVRTILKGVGWFWIYRFVNFAQFWRRLLKPKKKWF